MKVKAMLNRLAPFWLLSAEEASDQLAFDAYPVEVEDTTLKNAQDLRKLMIEAEVMIFESGAPEDTAQTLADFIENELRLICKTRKQDNG